MLATRSRTKTRKYSLCFVDDDEHELRRFKRVFEDEFYVGIGTDLGKAEANLREVLPRRMFQFFAPQGESLCARYVLSDGNNQHP
jgi:hypothetical protein